MAFETQVSAENQAPHDAAVRSVLVRHGGMRALCLAALAVVTFQILQGLNPDTSWLFTVADRWLDGSVPYRDIYATDPPLSILLVLPAAWAGRIAHVPAEWIFICAIVVLALAAIEWTVRVLATDGTKMSPARTRLALGFAVLILPMAAFAEPEHIAVLFLLPVLAVMGLRARKAPVTPAFILVAGLGAGLAICLKPQFAAAILLPALVVARAERRFSGLIQREYLIALAVTLAYGVLVVVAFPAYLSDMLPILTDLYRPVREPIISIVSTPVVAWTLLALGGFWMMVGGRVHAPGMAIPLLASLGFALAYIEQSKGFAVQFYPIVAVLVPAFADSGIERANAGIAAASGPRRLVMVAGFVAMAAGLGFATLTFVSNDQPMAGLRSRIARLAPPHPKIVAISSHISVGHPLTRDVGGNWVGSEPYAFWTLGALYKLGLRPSGEVEQARLRSVIGLERGMMADDIGRGRADVVIVEHDDLVFPAWFGSDPALQRFLKGYARADVGPGPLDVWLRER